MRTIIPFIVSCICIITITLAYHTIDVMDKDESLGLHLSLTLEILSLELRRSKSTAGLKPGDRIVGVNGVIFTNAEMNIQHFTTILSDVNAPYTIQIEYVNSSLPRVRGASVETPLEAILEVRFTTTFPTMFINTTISVASVHNLSIFSCVERPIVVAYPISGCAKVDGVLGAYVLVSRGVCPFEAKFQNVLLSGGAGVIVINSDDTSFMIPMAETKEMASIRRSDVPLVMITKSDGNSLVSSLLHGVSVDNGDLPIGYKKRGSVSNTASGILSPRAKCGKIKDTSISSVAVTTRQNKELQNNRGINSFTFTPITTKHPSDKASPHALQEGEVSTFSFEQEYHRLQILLHASPGVFNERRARNLVLLQIKSLPGLGNLIFISYLTSISVFLSSIHE